MSLSRDPVFSYLKKNFVVGYKDITGKPYCGASGRHSQDQGSTDTTNGSGNRNVQLFVIAPDSTATVLHAMPGYWNPHDLVRELKFAEELGALWKSGGDFAYKQDTFHRMQLEHVEKHPPQTARRSEIQGFDRGTEVARNERAGRGSSGDPSTTIEADGAGERLKTTDVIMHERMALRPFLPYKEFDVAAFVDYGGTFYDKHADHDNNLASRDSARRRARGDEEPAEAGSGTSHLKAHAATGDHRMVNRGTETARTAPADPPAADFEPVRPPPPPRPVLAFRINGISGAGGEYSAVISFKGREYTVSPGDVLPSAEQPAFTVKSITGDKVTVQATGTETFVTVAYVDETTLARR